MKRFALLTVLVATLFGSPDAARAEEPTHEIHAAATHAAVGVPGKAALTVHGKNGWHVNPDAPITLSAKAEADVVLPKAKLARADLAESTKENARFEIPFTASSPGKKTIAAEARFVMCQEQACKPVKETVALELDVAGAANTAPPSPAKSSKKKTKANSATP